MVIPAALRAADEVVFARTLGPKYAFTLAPDAERTVVFTLRKGEDCP